MQINVIGSRLSTDSTEAGPRTNSKYHHIEPKGFGQMSTSRTLAIVIAPLALAGWLAWRHISPPSPLPPPASATTHMPAQPASPGTPHIAPATKSPNLYHQYRTLKQRAEGGNAVAQRLVAQVLIDCAHIYDHPLKFTPLELSDIPADSPESMSIDAHRALQQDCAQVEGGARVTMKDGEHWYRKAAANGDLTARAIVNMSRHPPFSADEAQRFLDDVIASKDPVAVFAYGNVMGGPVTENLGEVYGSLVSGKASLAWMLAGCRMGMDCGPESPLVTNHCLHHAVCGKGDYEQAMKSEIESETDREALDQQIEAILAILETP